MTLLPVPSMAELSAGEARPLRLLGVLRISLTTERGSGIVSQRKDILRAASDIGAIIIGWAEDSDVSASKTTPFQRPQLSPWLKERVNEFDGIITWKLDRLVRKAADLRELLTYLTVHKKRLISAKEAAIDFDPNSEDLLKQMICDIFMTVVAIIAQMETANLKTRVEAKRDLLLSLGFWPGGVVPYGFKLVDGFDAGTGVRGKRVEQDKEAVSVIRRIAGMLLSRDPEYSRTDIVRALASDRVPTPTERKIELGEKRADFAEGYKPVWSSEAVNNVVRNRLLIGELIQNGEVYREQDGGPKIFVDPVFTQDEFRRLEENISSRWQQRKSNAGREGLSGMIECRNCGAPIYTVRERRQLKSGDHASYLYYRCSSGGQNRIVTGNKCMEQRKATKSMTAANLHERIEIAIREQFAAQDLYEDIYVPGIGSTEELERTERAISDLLTDRQSGKFSADQYLLDLYHVQLSALSARRTDLLAQGVTESRWERVKTDKTLWDEWTNADWEKRRQLIHMAGIVIRVDIAMDLVEIEEDPDMAQRIASYADGGKLPELPRRTKRTTTTDTVAEFVAMVTKQQDDYHMGKGDQPQPHVSNF